jgi:protease IV
MAGRVRIVRISCCMSQPLPPGQGPVDPRGAFGAPPGPVGAGARPWTPPPMPMMFPPPPPRRRVGVWIVVILLIVGLGISVLVNVVQFGMAMGAAGVEVKHTILSGEGPEKIAVVPVDGLIDDDSSRTFDAVLKDVAKDSSVKAVVVEMNTPGGSATAADEMYHRLDRFKSEKHVPVVVAMSGMATSGGYYVSCAADYIFAEPTCLTGNIGVLFPRFNMSKMIDKWGVAETTLTATVPGHSYKNAGSMFEPENPLDEKYLQGLVDGTFAQFKAVVLAGRKGKLIDKSKDIFSGKAFLAQEALDRGLIDQVGYPDKAYDYAASLAGITNPLVVQFAPRPTLLQLLSARSGIQRNSSGAFSGMVSIDGFSVDARAAEELLTARPLLLWRGN